jgi:hypothetical protein
MSAFIDVAIDPAVICEHIINHAALPRVSLASWSSIRSALAAFDDTLLHDNLLCDSLDRTPMWASRPGGAVDMRANACPCLPGVRSPCSFAWQQVPAMAAHPVDALARCCLFAAGVDDDALQSRQA